MSRVVTPRRVNHLILAFLKHRPPARHVDADHSALAVAKIADRKRQPRLVVLRPVPCHRERHPFAPVVIVIAANVRHAVRPAVDHHVARDERARHVLNPPHVLPRQDADVLSVGREPRLRLSDVDQSPRDLVLSVNRSDDAVDVVVDDLDVVGRPRTAPENDDVRLLVRRVECGGRERLGLGETSLRRVGDGGHRRNSEAGEIRRIENAIRQHELEPLRRIEKIEIPPFGVNGRLCAVDHEVVGIVLAANL